LNSCFIAYALHSNTVKVYKQLSLTFSLVVYQIMSEYSSIGIRYRVLEYWISYSWNTRKFRRQHNPTNGAEMTKALWDTWL